MSKNTLMLLPMLMLSLGARGQEVADSALLDESFIFSDTQMDESENDVQTITSLANYSEDLFMTEQGYLFSPMRFRARALDGMYNGFYINGMLMNDAENGRYGYSRITGGLNDVTKNQQGILPYEQNTVGYMDLGGGQNTNMRAADYAAGNKFTGSLTNRNYVLRGMFTHASGLRNGWAWVASAGIRYSDEGNIEGTFYHAGSLMLGLQRVFNDQHSLSLTAMAVPTRRAMQGASTEEAYWLANSHYYNPNWGYQNGKKRSARVTSTMEPTALLTWDWNIGEKSKLTTTGVFRYGWYGSTRLEYTNNVTKPAPDYYSNMPSNAFNVWEDVPTEWQLEKWTSLYNWWTSSKANRQINWDRMYEVNQASVAAGGEAKYYLEEYHNDQMVFGLSSAFNHVFDKFNRLDAGIQLNHTKGMHYKTMKDLLGANYHTDIDHYSVTDYGKYSYIIQNDMDNPDQKIYEGDRFEYDYDINVNKLQGWAMYTYSKGAFSTVVGADLQGETIERYSHMRNGRGVYYEGDQMVKDSKGSSGTARFLGGGGKVSFGYTLSAQHKLLLSAGYELRPPVANYSFVAPRIKSDFVSGLTNEKVLHGDLTYRFNFGKLSGKLSGYYSKFTDQVEQTAYYDDLASRFTYLTMNGVEKQYYGAELALRYNLLSNLSFTFLGSLGEAKYTNNPNATLTYSSAAEVTTYDDTHDMPLRVIADGMRVDGTPLTALSIGADYSINNWFFGINLNYYDRVYVGFSESRRLTKNMTAYAPTVDAQGHYVYGVDAQTLHDDGALYLNTDGALVDATPAHQEKFDGGFMLDASIGKFIRLHGGRTMSINLSAQNITNNRNLRTGGYEQNRADTYASGVERAYVFSKNSKYYYANPINLFLNVNIKF